MTIQKIQTGLGLPQSSPGPPKRSVLESSEPEAIELDWGDGSTGESDNSDVDTTEMMDWPDHPE